MVIEALSLVNILKKLNQFCSYKTIFKLPSFPNKGRNQAFEIIMFVGVCVCPSTSTFQPAAHFSQTMNTGEHLSAIHFHFLQSFTNNMIKVQISEVGLTLAPLL
jgi:hypothetical protein